MVDETKVESDPEPEHEVERQLEPEPGPEPEPEHELVRLLEPEPEPEPEPAPGADAALEEALPMGRLRSLTQRSKVEAAKRKDQAESELTRWRDRSVLVDIAALVAERDKAAAGSVVSSAVAFRLFLFFVPTLLFAVGIAGFVAKYVDAVSVNEAAGVTGTLADQIRTAFSQPGSTRWFAILAGLFGMLTAGRTLTRVLAASSALAWRVPRRLNGTVRAMSSVIGVLVAVALLASFVNRMAQRGVALAGVSLLTAALVYGVAWLLLSRSLPRGTSDPGATLPGAAVFAGTMVLMQALTQFLLVRQVSSASQLYGAIGATVTTLGWFFFIGRAVVLAMVLDAVVFERVGSISTVFFSLPLVRVLPRRSPRLRRFFDLEDSPGHDSPEIIEPPAELEPTSEDAPSGGPTS